MKGETTEHKMYKGWIAACGCRKKFSKKNRVDDKKTIYKHFGDGVVPITKRITLKKKKKKIRKPILQTSTRLKKTRKMRTRKMRTRKVRTSGISKDNAVETLIELSRKSPRLLYFLFLICCMMTRNFTSKFNK